MSIKIPSTRLIIAGIVAVVADIVQWLLIPAFSELGFLSPVNDILDAAVAFIMVSLLGFHWVFVPSALGKLVPVADMMPLWTGAVFFVAAGQNMIPSAHPNSDSAQILPGIIPSPQVHTQPALPSGAAISHTIEGPTAHSVNPFNRENDFK